MKNRTVFIAVFFIYAFLHPAYAGAGERLVAYAGTEESIAEELFFEFKTATGIEVEWERLSGGEAVARIEAEKNAPRASIWVGGVGTMHIDLKNKGLTIPFSPPEAAKVSDKMRDPDRYWVGLYIGPLAVCVNKNLIKRLNLPTPKSWQDLLNPAYKGHIRVAHPAISGTAYNLLTTIIRVKNGDEDAAFDYFKQLNGSIDYYTKSGSSPVKACALGEVVIAIGYRHDQARMQSQGAPLEIIMPLEGSGYETASMSLIKNGPRTDLAEKLYAWMLGPKASEILVSWQILPLAGIHVMENNIGPMKLVDQDDIWDAKNKSRLVERWNREISADYK